MMIRAFLLSAFLCATSITAMAQQPTEFLTQGNDAYQKNEYKKAIELYTSAISGSPSLTQAYYNRGLAYMQSKQSANALRDFSKVIELDPRFKDAYLNRSFINIVEHRVTDAVPDLTAYLKIDGLNATAWFNRGQAYQEMGKNDSAMADFTKAISIDTTLMSAYLARGVNYAREGKTDLAIKDLERATRLNPEEPLGWLNLGQAYFSAGHGDSAGTAWRKFITMEKGTARSKQVDTMLIEMCQDTRGVVDKAFQDTSKLVSIKLPQHWFTNTQDDGKVFNFFVSKERIDKPQDMYTSGVAIHMLRDVAKNYNLKDPTPTSIVTFWTAFLDDASKEYDVYTVSKTEPIKVGAWTGSIRDITLRIKKEYYTVHKWEAVVANRDNVLWVTAECPADLWPAFRDRFRKAIETMRLP